MSTNNKFEPILSQIKSNLQMVEGEIYKFISDNKKRSAAVARKCFLAIRKACSLGRAELQSMKAALPVRRRNISDQTKARMADARAARAAKKRGKKAAPVAVATPVVAAPVKATKVAK